MAGIAYRRAILAGLLAWLLAVAGSHAAELPSAQVSAILQSRGVHPGSAALAAVTVQIPQGMHAQSHTPTESFYIKFQVDPQPNPDVEFLPPVYPPGELVSYPDLGRLSVYTGRVVVYLPMRINAQAAVGSVIPISGRVTYQLCDQTACYPPATQEYRIEAQVISPSQTLFHDHPDIFAGYDQASAAALPASMPLGRVFGLELGPTTYALAFFAAFVIGIIFNAVPCVLPVVPLKAIGFYEVSRHNRAKCFALGLVFSAGLVATFAVLALLVVVFKWIAWGELFSNFYFLAAIVAVLLVFAFSQFGAFSVGLPTGIYRITPRHDTYLGNFLFGILAAILSTPCTFGLFLTLLVWAVSQPPVLGTGLVMTVGLGMAFPYLVLSALPELARKMPRSGPWAKLVKEMMGFLLLLSALYFAQAFLVPYTGHKAFWWSLFAVVVAAAVFLIGRTIQFATGRLGPAVAVILALLLVAPSLAVTLRLTNSQIDWQPYSPQALERAQASGHPVMVEFTAAWCANCLALEATVFHDKEAVAAIRQNQVIALRSDLTMASAPGWRLLKQLNPVGAIPLTVIYPAAGQRPLQLRGIYSAGDLLSAIQEATSAPAGELARTAR